MPAGTACCRCPWAGSTATRWSAATTALYSMRGPLHTHAVAGDDQPVGLRARLSGRGAAPLRLGVAGRCRAGRPGADPRPALERRPGLGRRRQADPGEVRLPAGARQPDGPDARDLRARRSIGDRAVAEAPFVATHGDRSATVTRWMEEHRRRRRSGPGRSAMRAATPGRSTAGRSSASRRHAPWPSTSAWRLAGTGAKRATGDRSQGVNGYVLNTITPETDDELPLLLGLCPQLLT
jgi:hypothetical protein